MNKFLMSLSFLGNELISRVNISIQPLNLFTFHLGPNLIIDEIIVNDKSVIYHAEKTKLEFIGDVNKVTINYPSITKINIKYHGMINGWHNIISEEKILLSSYSCYYPHQCNINFNEAMIYVEKGQDYELVNGSFDDKLNQWLYNAADADYFDYNIALFKKGFYFKEQVNNLTFYTTKQEELEIVNKATKLCEEILEYYTKEIYHIEKNNPISVVSNGLETGGAYVRKKLIMLNFLRDNDHFLYRMFGHELGHLWATGADTSTFEDWLNETCAEWSCLAFMNYKKRYDFFEKEINLHLEYAKKYPTIITKDGSRPEGVHFAGVSLFYEIYKIYGIDPIIGLLKIFYDLKLKTTKQYLEDIKVYNQEIYEILVKNLYE